MENGAVNMRMDGEARWTLVAELSAAAATTDNALAALQRAVRALAANFAAGVEVWTPTPGAGSSAWRLLIGDAPRDRGGREAPEAAPVLAQAAATRRIVVGPATADAALPLALALPLPALDRVPAVLLLRPRPEAPDVPLAGGRGGVDQAVLTALAPVLGLLVHSHTLAPGASATYDPITGLANRRQLDEHIDRELARARRTRRPLSLLLVGLDRAEALQVAHGPAAGERALAMLATLLRAACRDGDSLGRYGVSQLLALLPDSGGAGARIAANRLLNQVARAVLTPPGGSPQPLAASVGIALFPVDGLAAGELLESAATALAEAQHQGGNRTVAA